MIVNQAFLDELKTVEQQDIEGFERTLNYTVSYIAKSDTTTRLNEILEIEEEDANELLRVFLRLVSFFAKFNAGEREFKAHLEMINLTPEQKQLFTYKMKENEKHLRKTLGLLERDNEPEYSNLKWRFDLQGKLLILDVQNVFSTLFIKVASRCNEEETKPKILLELDLLTNGKVEGNLIETDYAGLKHLHEELSAALKLHNSLQQKKIQKKFL